MNQQSKRAIKSLVLELRHTLEDEIEIQLKRFGFAGDRWLPIDRLPHIAQDDRAAADHFRLQAALEQHLRRIGADPDQAKPKQRAEAVDWFVREVAFTHLNRLVALKCLEVRDLIPEIITTRDAYGGRSKAHRDYRHVHPAAARAADDALPDAIRHICRQVYAEFKFLFDVGDPATGQEPPAHSILWPSAPVLKRCIALINGLDEEAGHRRAIATEAQRNTERGRRATATEAQRNTERRATEAQGNAENGTEVSGDSENETLWAEDEIIGWIYQFYNAEEKEAVRARGRPRRPAEVAVINQFFTPRWIVKFLVDNTLGRLWLEMHPDSERVREKCDYLVPEPLPAGDGDDGFTLDPDSPINDPGAPARREAKRPQDLRLIDPACGTMHFGHYAFEVFQAIYQDARDQGWVTGRDALPDAAIPAAILRHNLYGVDIDLRAVQLAGLSLFIKAKSTVPDAHIGRVNLVVADAVLPEDGARTEFLAQYADNRAVQEAVAQVLEEMENVAEVGSLLRVEERLRSILGEAGSAVADLDPELQRDLPGMESPTRQLSLADAAGATPEEWGAHYTLTRLLEDLRGFAAHALQTHDLNAQLFAQEAEKSVHLLDVFMTDYDVVVMNPPFGSTLDDVKSYLNRSYRAFCGNLLCAFVERGLSDFAPQGFLGAVLDRTFLLKMTYESFRKEVLLGEGSLLTFTDLGWNVLDDANVEVSTVVVDAQGEKSEAVFFRAPEGVDLGEVTAPVETMKPFVVSTRDFETFPNVSFAYWTPKSVRRMFSKLPPLDPTIGTAKEGIHPNKARRFLRTHWEVDSGDVGRSGKWVPVANGGGYSPFYRDNQFVILYEDEAEAIKSLRGMRNEHLQFREGITWGKRTDLISLQHLPKGHAFTHEGHCLFPDDKHLLWLLLAILNSSLMQYTINTLCGQHKTSGYVGQLPYAEPKSPHREKLDSAAEQAHDLKFAWNTGNEACTRFDVPWLVQAHRGTLLADLDPGDRERLEIPSAPSESSVAALLDYVRAVEEAADARLHTLQAQIDEAVYDLYDIDRADRALIARELGDRPPELVWPQMERKSDKEKRREHVRRLISYFLLRALQEKRDGIIPLSDGTGHETALKVVRNGLEEEFGEGATFQMEAEIKSVLGRDIADWLDGPFIKWHTKLYQRRPVIWQISSPDYYHYFNCFVYIHKLDRDTLHKVQTQYLWTARRSAEAELEAAQGAQDAGRIEDAERVLEDFAAFEEQLLSVIQAKVAYTPPAWAEGPYRGGVYDPVLDDGVKVNIMPLQKGELLRYKKLV